MSTLYTVTYTSPTGQVAQDTLSDHIAVADLVHNLTVFGYTDIEVSSPEVYTVEYLARDGVQHEILCSSLTAATDLAHILIEEQDIDADVFDDNHVLVYVTLVPYS
jgi:hypothetical protein